MELLKKTALYQMSCNRQETKKGPRQVFLKDIEQKNKITGRYSHFY